MTNVNKCVLGDIWEKDIMAKPYLKEISMAGVHNLVKTAMPIVLDGKTDRRNTDGMRGWERFTGSSGSRNLFEMIYGLYTESDQQTTWKLQNTTN